MSNFPEHVHGNSSSEIVLEKNMDNKRVKLGKAQGKTRHVEEEVGKHEENIGYKCNSR